ncbi:hypothetical protein PR202_gb06021 [Eleusine coracana subsp. coracana]|uniref:AUGMIN subunit 4 n=1 Tax=Eleusine coracana subsp. coracana TaxID=191504 RepID=A0AAV5E6U6_ELECO|nr:hypothetical protein PR202_gb06021 [Eleusine coracana subsp. coracana]
MSKAAAASLPPPPPEVAHLVDQIQRHHLAPDASLLSNSAHADLLQARDEVASERALYLEALAVYAEAVAMVEEYHAAGGAGAGKRLNCSPQVRFLSCIRALLVYESLEHRLSVAEAAQRLRLPLLSQDGEVHEEEIEKLSTLSRSSFDSTLTSATPSSSSISTSYNNYSSTASAVTVGAGPGVSEPAEPGVGGVPDRFLGITSDYLYQVQQEQPAMSVDMVDYQRTLAREIEARLEAKCDVLADLFAMDERDSSSISQISSARLPERKYLVEATKEASNSYNEAGVDPHFDVIARQYHEIVKKLEGMQWTIHQVEMDLKPSA